MNKVVTLRRALLFFFFLLTPIIQFYFSPFIPITGALNGAITISLFVFAALFCIGLFFGRAPCGWFMLCGGLQDACAQITEKRIRAGKKDRIKYYIFAGWLTALLIFLIVNSKRLHLDLFYMFDNGISVSNVYGYIPYYVVLITVFILALVMGRRPVCHYGCWMAPFMILGRKVGNFLKFPGLRIKSNVNNCTGCKSCAKVCPMGIEVDQLIRAGRIEHPECIMCMECVKACKSNVLRCTLSR